MSRVHFLILVLLVAYDPATGSTTPPGAAVKVHSDGEAYAEVEFSTSLRANAPQDTPEPPIFRVSRRVFGDYTADGGVPVSELQVLVERTVDGVRETSVALAITEDGAVSVPGDLAVGDAGLTVNRLAERLNEVVEALRLVNITAHDAHAKAHDLAHDGSSPAKAARTCRSLLTSGATLSGEYWVKPCDVADPFLAFCDMTRDGGGWTRVLSYHQTQTPIARFADWPDASSVSDVAATRAFKGCLDAFDGGEIREEATSGAATVWATNVATSQFEEVMLTFGYDDCDDRVLNSRLPNCASTYGGDETHTACTRYPTSTNALGQPGPHFSVLGWQRDIHAAGHCWSGRGRGYTSAGSSTCGGDPDGTKWAHMYFRDPST